MAENFWFKFYFKDWADDVKPLSLTARGLLIELIIEMRKQEGVIENNIRMISRLSGGLTEEVTESLAEFRRFGTFDFEKIDGKDFLVSRKILKELRISLINKENGSKGGNPKLKNSDNRKTKRMPIFNFNSEFIFKSNTDIIFPFTTEIFMLAWGNWIEYRKEIKKPLKSAIGIQAQLKKLSELSDHNEEIAIEIIMQSIERSWTGLFKLKKEYVAKQQSGRTHEERVTFYREYFSGNKKESSELEFDSNSV